MSGVTPAIIAQAYEDAGVTTTKDIIAGVLQSMAVVEARIASVYTTLPVEKAHEASKQDRVLLKAQVNFLDNLEGRR